jgi:hypothetical protein
MGAIVRNSNGKFIAASWKEVHFLTDAMMAGAYALRDGLSLAQHLGCQNFIFQSNNMQVIKTMLLGGVSSRSSVAIYDRWLPDSIFGFSKYHVSTQSKEKLARHSSSNHVDCFLDDEPHRFLFPKLVKDTSLFIHQ